MKLKLIGESKYSTKVDEHELIFFLNEKLMRSINIDQGVQATQSLMAGVKTEGPIIFLPDYTPANSLPIGTSFIINHEQLLKAAGCRSEHQYNDVAEHHSGSVTTNKSAEY